MAGGVPFGPGQNNPVVATDNVPGASFLQRVNGVWQKSEDGGVNFGSLGDAYSFSDETISWARRLMPDLGFDRVVGTDFTPAWEAALSPASTPARNTFFGGGGLAFSGAGNSWVALNPTIPSGFASRQIAVTATDNVVAGTHTWVFANGAFSAGDVGGALTMSGATNPNNNATVSIVSVTNPTTIVTGGTQTNETFSTAVTAAARSASTYSPIIGNQFQTRAVPWFARARLFINATQVGATNELVLLSVDKSTTGLANGVGHIQLVIIAAGGSGPPSPTQVRVRLRGGAFTAGPVDFSAGPDGNLGVFGSYLPVNQWFNVALWFDLETIRWAFSDIYNNPANALNGLAHQLDAMPPDAGCVTVNSSALNDTAIGTNYLIGGLAMAYATSQENK